MAVVYGSIQNIFEVTHEAIYVITFIMGKFVIKKNKAGYSYHFEGDDALILGSSDNHKTLASARIGIESIRSIAAECRLEDQSNEKAKVLRNPKFEIYRDGNKKLRFNMKAKNGQKVLSSVPFKEMDALLAAVDVIRQTASASAVQSQTNLVKPANR